MGYDCGRATVAGTGSKTLLMTGLTGAPTGCRITTAEGAYVSVGVSSGIVQSYIYSGPTHGSGSTKIGHLENAASTVVWDASWTSFGTSAGQGTVVLNVATSTAARPILIEAWN